MHRIQYFHKENFSHPSLSAHASSNVNFQLCSKCHIFLTKTSNNSNSVFFLDPSELAFSQNSSCVRTQDVVPQCESSARTQMLYFSAKTFCDSTLSAILQHLTLCLVHCYSGRCVKALNVIKKCSAQMQMHVVLCSGSCVRGEDECDFSGLQKNISNLFQFVLSCTNCL